METVETPEATTKCTPYHTYLFKIDVKKWQVRQASKSLLDAHTFSLLTKGAIVNLKQDIPRHIVESERMERIYYGNKGSRNDVEACRRILKKARRDRARLLGKAKAKAT